MLIYSSYSDRFGNRLRSGSLSLSVRYWILATNVLHRILSQCTRNMLFMAEWQGTRNMLCAAIDDGLRATVASGSGAAHAELWLGRVRFHIPISLGPMGGGRSQQ